MAEQLSFWRLAIRRDVMMRAVKVGLIVGTILGAINHGDVLVNGGFTTINALKALLTYLVPYGVATYSAVRALQTQE